MGRKGLDSLVELALFRGVPIKLNQLLEAMALNS